MVIISFLVITSGYSSVETVNLNIIKIEVLFFKNTKLLFSLNSKNGLNYDLALQIE